MKLSRQSGDEGVLISFQKWFKLWRIRLHVAILIHRNMLVKLIMRTASHYYGRLLILSHL